MTNPKTYKRGHPLALLLTTILALLAASLPIALPTAADWRHDRLVNSEHYKQTKGHWDELNLPPEFKLNAIHAALLPSGKVLLVAGSGNNRANFDAYKDSGTMQVLKTVLYDPATDKFKTIATPSDLFCSGHTLLQSGDVLVAGGTIGYELLDGAVTKPAGPMIIHNENPNSEQRVLPKGTAFTSQDGRMYLSTDDVLVKPATKMTMADGSVMVEHSSTQVFVEAAEAKPSYNTTKAQTYHISSLQGNDAHDIYGQAQAMTLNKQDYRGDNKAYQFNPISEQYVRVGDMNVSRWYASLPVMNNGDVLAVSGLDNVGLITNTTERYKPASQTWEWGPNQSFPTYPALFRTKDPDSLFFSGSSAGYGPADKGRRPGFWNVKSNAFTPVRGLRQPDLLETSASVALPPVAGSNDGTQSSKIMVAGGGGVAESPKTTARTDIIDLAADQPKFQAGPDLPKALRYLNVTVTPWDDLFINGGSSDYRAKGNSYSYQSYSLNPTTNTITTLADELVGRTYHSGSLLLPDGRIMVFGGDPLFSDKKNTTTGTFEQRLEIYTPPQLYSGPRPVLSAMTNPVVERGQSLDFTSSDAGSLRTARLIPPSTSTHVTNIEQRSVAAPLHASGNKVTIDLPSDQNLLPNGWYMLFVTNGRGTPSTAAMVHIGALSNAAE